MTKTLQQGVGALGEAIAARFLEGKGYAIIDRNYRKPWGEIDIVASHESVIVFVEVKTVSRETNNSGNWEKIRPEENMHKEKIGRLSRAIATYLAGKRLSIESSWRMDLVAVELDIGAKIGKCRHFESVF